jgi:hypothetical protein
VQLVGGQLGTAQYKADLRAIAVSNRHIPTIFDHWGNVFAGFVSRYVLITNRLLHLVPDQRITANGNYSCFAAHFYSNSFLAQKDELIF